MGKMQNAAMTLQCSWIFGHGQQSMENEGSGVLEGIGSSLCVIS